MECAATTPTGRGWLLVEIRFLGALTVTADNRRIPLGGSRQQITLATLLLDANHPVTMARLTGAIYEDNIPSTARSQVQICISALRRLFASLGEPDIITTVSPGYVIQCAPQLIDFHRFDDWVRQAREARQAGRAGDAVERYRAGLAEWQGPAFDGIESRLVQTVAERLNERWVTTSEDCFELELGLGRHRELVGELLELVATHPLRERLREQLMTALYRSGRQAEALQGYRQARETMLDELGIEPNERLQQLHRAILTNDDSLDLPAAKTSTVPVEPTTALLTTGRPPPDPPPPGPPPPDALLADAIPVSAIPVNAIPISAIPSSTAPVSVPPVLGGAAIPRLLPTDIDDFTGRAKQIDSIRQQLLLAFGDTNRHAVPVIVLAGKPGIGKSTIAVHASHAIADLFPDGQLFADLHGGTSNLVGSTQVLERFLRALCPPGTLIPDGLEERAEIYRGLLAGRRMLIVLDDAANEGQVRPLLPGNRESAVLVTSRSRLAGLAGAIHLEVDVFEPDQSMDLIARIAGRSRVDAEPAATLELAQLCGQLPLALRIAGARLSARPHWSVEQLVIRLEDETRRLDELNHGGMGIRASISFAYESASAAARRLFRRLAILDSNSVSGWVSAALLDLPLTESEDLLEDLADAQLIEPTGAGRGIASQYRFHDLIRVFARERLAADEDATDRKAALTRVLGALLFMMEQAHRREYGADYLQIHSAAPRWPLPARQADRLIDEPLAWYERERSTLVSGIRQAADAGLTDLCWDLAISAVTLFESRMYLDDWRDTHDIALAATRQAGDLRGTAAVLCSLGSLRITQRRFDDARRGLEAAVPLFDEVGDRLGAALTTRNIAYLDRMSGHPELAAAGYQRALAVFRDTGDQVAAAYVLHNLAQLRLDDDDLDGAQRLLDEALDLSQQGGSRRVQAQVLHRKGETHMRRGDPTAAAAVFQQTLRVVQQSGDRAGEANILHGLGMAELATGRLDEAERVLHRAAQLAAETDERFAQTKAALGLGELALARGDAELAIRHGTEALRLARAIAVPALQARALGSLVAAHIAAGDRQHAETTRTDAMRVIDTLDETLARQERDRLPRPV